MDPRELSHYPRDTSDPHGAAVNGMILNRSLE
jgi:hypothetical protein